MFIEHFLNLIGGIGLIHASGNQQLAYLDGIKVEFICDVLEGRMVNGTVEIHSGVHLILKDGAWVVVRLGWLTTTTGFSLCFLFHVVHSHITHTASLVPHYGILFPLQTIYTLPQKAVCTIFWKIIKISSTRQSSQNLITFGSWVNAEIVATPFLK